MDQVPFGTCVRIFGTSTCEASGQNAADLSGLSQAMTDTVTQARDPSTRQAYVLKWSLFIE